MTQYRYARTVGEFLTTKFVGKSSPKGTFTTLESYDLTKKFASGTDKYQDSFISPDPITAYYTSTKQLVAWWRLDKDLSTSLSVADSSGHGHTMYTSASVVPTYEPGTTPSIFIQSSSVVFSSDGSDDQLRAHDSDSFSFVDGGHDTPFSISAWIKPSSLTNSSTYIVSKYGASGAREWTFAQRYSGKIEVILVSPLGYVVEPTDSVVLSVGTWTHVVFTYDGRGGNKAGFGCKIYINGKLDTTGAGTSLYKSMSNTSGLVAIGKTDGGNSNFDGNIAEVAIWRKELLASEVASLYGVKNAGAYRLVRDYSQKSRVIDEVGGNDTVQDIALADENTSGSSAFYREGINIVTMEDLTGFTRRKLRPNSNFILTLNGRDMPRNSFNDTFSPSCFVQSAYNNGVKESLPWTTGSSRARVSVSGKISARVSHERERRDLGQPDPYLLDSSPYHETVTVTSGVFNPVALLKIHPFVREVPPYIVDQTDLGGMNGVIEPFPIRSIIDHSITEIPFTARGVKCAIDSMTDSFKRSMIIKDGYNLNEYGASPFLDAVEMMGIADTDDSQNVSGSVTIQGVFYQDQAKITPFVDRSCDVEQLLTGTLPLIAGSPGAAVLSQSLPRRIDFTAVGGIVINQPAQSNNSTKNFDIMGYRGFVFNNDSTHVDSIAYGGWKK